MVGAFADRDFPAPVRSSYGMRRHRWRSSRRASRATRCGTEPRPLYGAGDYAAVADRGGDLIAAHPTNAQLIYNIACCESLAGRSADAMSTCARRSRSRPTRCAAWRSRTPTWTRSAASRGSGSSSSSPSRRVRPSCQAEAPAPERSEPARSRAATNIGTDRGPPRRELGHPGVGGIDVDRLEPAAAEVGLMPERRAAAVAQILGPPPLVRQRQRPRLQRVEVAPVLAHADMGRLLGVGQPLVEQQSVRPLPDRGLDLRPQYLKSPRAA